MSKQLLLTLVSFVVLSCATGQKVPESDWNGGVHYERARELRKAANLGDADAMMELSNLLSKYAPDPEKNRINECNGKRVSVFAKKKLEAQGQTCRLVDNVENRNLVDNWRSVGTKADAWTWLERAATAGNLDAIAIQCALDQFDERVCSTLFD